MIQLKENGGIPNRILLMMSIVGGLTVANLYYNQPLLEEMRASLGIGELEANLITVITQIGYALGLLLVVPMADMWSRRKIVITSMSIAVLMASAIALATNVWIVWGASIILGACSVVPQIFVPMAGLFSRPEENKPAIWDLFCRDCLRACWQRELSADIWVDGLAGDSCLASLLSSCW